MYSEKKMTDILKLKDINSQLIRELKKQPIVTSFLAVLSLCVEIVTCFIRNVRKSQNSCKKLKKLTHVEAAIKTKKEKKWTSKVVFWYRHSVWSTAFNIIIFNNFYWSDQ